MTGVTKALTSSGATVSGTVEVADAWTDPAKRSFRDQLFTSLAPLVGLEEASGTLDSRMGALLARALVVDRVSDADQPSTSATQALTALKEAGLASFEGDGPAPATLAVVVAPPPDDKVRPTNGTRTWPHGSPWPASSMRPATARWSVGDESDGTSGGLVRTLRADDGWRLRSRRSTTSLTAMGRIALVYALRQQMAGEAGQYGVGQSASALLPLLTASVP